MKKTILGLTTGHQSILKFVLSKYKDTELQMLRDLIADPKFKVASYYVEVPMSKHELILLFETLSNYIYAHYIGTIDMYTPYIDVLETIQECIPKVIEQEELSTDKIQALLNWKFDKNKIQRSKKS